MRFVSLTPAKAYSDAFPAGYDSAALCRIGLGRPWRDGPRFVQQGRKEIASCKLWVAVALWITNR